MKEKEWLSMSSFFYTDNDILPLRLRIIVEDIDTFHQAAEKLENYFGSRIAESTLLKRRKKVPPVDILIQKFVCINATKLFLINSRCKAFSMRR
jgi:antitoxin component HigA of HigAB toxin-antitoxin module